MNVKTPQPDDFANGAAVAGSDSAASDAGGEGKSTGSRPIKFLYPTGSQPLEGYTIKRGVGRGGFGEVYFATSDAGKEVALKLIRRNLDVELRGVKHCLNLKHHNLISIYDIRTDSLGDEWVVMEYVSGESLEDAIERYPNGMPTDLVLKWMQGIGSGVAYLHDHGIVHRDLKPGNVFLDDDAGGGLETGGMVKIGDYGLSKFISCSRRSGQTESVGTVHYMAPEIANGRYGREIDTYALGIILYEMLTGHVPFEGESVGEVLMKHLTADPNLDMLEEPYRDIVRRTLAKDPEIRIGSVTEMLALLPDGRSVGPLYTGSTNDGGPLPSDQHLQAGRQEGWTNAHAAADGIGAAHLFPDTSVRGEAPVGANRSPGRRHAMTQGEPLFALVANTWHSMVDGWLDWDFNPAGKSVLLFIMVAMAVVTVPWWGFVAVPLVVFYLFYYIFWLAFIEPPRRRKMRDERESRELAEIDRYGKQQAREQEAQLTSELSPEGIESDPSTHQPAQVPPAQRSRRQQAAARRRLRMGWREKAQQEIKAKPLREKTTELLSAMVLSGIFCTFLSLLAVALVGGELTSERVPLHLWLSAVSSLGCWVVLATNKFSEGRFEDQVPMRISLMIGGAVMGILAWSLSSTLLIGVPYINDMGPDFHDSFYNEAIGLSENDVAAQVSRHSYAVNLPFSVMYFATLMVAMRWWRLAEYTRRVRLSLVGVGLCMCGAWIAHLLCWYPMPAGMAVAAVMAVAVQLVSPWLPPSGRKKLQEASVAV